MFQIDATGAARPKVMPLLVLAEPGVPVSVALALMTDEERAAHDERKAQQAKRAERAAREKAEQGSP